MYRPRIVSLTSFARPLSLLTTALLVAAVVASIFAAPATVQAQGFPPFDSSGLQGENLSAPTSLEFGPDDRLYVSQQNGTIYAYTIVRNGPQGYSVTGTETINIVKDIANRDDDTGGPCSRGGKCNGRQVTGVLTAGTSTNPVLFVSSSDPDIGAGPGGDDKNLDTNSGIISRLTCVGGIDAGTNGCTSWEKIDLVRGLPRSEENHASNGMQLAGSPTGGTLYVAQGGHDNAGAPSNNFAFTVEYALSAALLQVDLAAIESLPTQGSAPHEYKYDLPTLDDPTRANANGITDPAAAGYDGLDVNDPFGGNDGLNQAKIVVGGPVQIYASGFRNLYDIVISESGKIYGVDNGANQSWGGFPEYEESYNCTNNFVAGEPGSTGNGPDPATYPPSVTLLDGNNGTVASDGQPDGQVNNKNGLHYITEGYYGGHPTPIRGNPAGAGLWFQAGNANNGSFYEPGNPNLPVDWPPVPISEANPTECDFQNSGEDDGALANYNPSTNGIAEYTASNFNGSLKGTLLAAAFNGNIYGAALNAAGDAVINCPAVPDNCNTSFASGFGGTPLDVTTQGDDDVFPGTVWAATYGANNITVFEPQDFLQCSGDDDDTIDEDGDGYSNADEIDSGTDQCSPAGVPSDNDGSVAADGFKDSDLNDPDDDDDGLLDTEDAFAVDAANGKSTSLPINYPLFNGDPGSGFYGVGFTGLMSNGSDYLTLQDPDEDLIVGGAAGIYTDPSVGEGDAFQGSNSQVNAFQFGIDVDSNTPPFTVRANLAGSFLGANPSGALAQGLYIGTGDQDNYLRLAITPGSDGNGGLQVLTENNGSTTESTVNVAGILKATLVELHLSVDSSAGTVQPKYIIDSGTVTPLGAPVSLSGALLSAVRGSYQISGVDSALAVGLVATSAGPAPEFDASWDYIEVDTDPVTAEGSWQLISDFDETRHENAFVQAGDKFYLLGGRESNNVKIYDLATGNWSTGAASPTVLNHFQAVELDGLIYAVTAFVDNNFPTEAPAQNIYIYDPLADEWLVGPEIPAARRRGGAGAAKYNGKIYVVSGNTNGHSGPAVTWFDEWDPATNTWTQLTDIPHARDHFFVEVVDNKLYAIGGRTSGNPDTFLGTVPQVDIYDFGSQTWSTLPAAQNIPTERAAASVGVLGNEIFVLGGERESGSAKAANEAFNVQTETWRTAAPMVTPRHGTQAIANNGGIYVAGGSPNRGGPGGATLDLEAFYLFGQTSPTGSALAAGALAAPASADFGSVFVGESASDVVVIDNTGSDQAIVIEAIALSGSGDFALAQPFAGPLAVGPGDSYSVGLNFAPTDAGAESGTLTVTHSGGETLAVALAGEGLDAPTPLVFINAGGTADYTDTQGNVWSADQDFSGGQIFAKNTLPIAGTEDDKLYQTERYGDFGYNLSLPNGDYVVDLHFAEIYFGSSTSPSDTGGNGKRLLDASIEGALVLDSYDIFADVGADAPAIKSFPIMLSDGELNINFTTVVNNAKVSAIAVYAAGDINFPPQVEPIPNQANVEGDDISDSGLAVSATDSDGPQNLAYTISGQPAGVDIEPTNGQIIGVIADGAAGNSPYAVTVAVSDGAASTDVQFTWVVTSGDNPPLISAIGDQQVIEGDTLSVPVSATDPDAGDTIALTIEIVDDATNTALDPATYTFTDNGDGTGQLSWTPQPGAAGSYSASVTASDGGNSSTEDFAIAVAQGPTLPIITLTSPAEGALLSGESVDIFWDVQLLESDDHIHIYVDGEKKEGSVDPTPPYTLNFADKGVEPGAHVLEVRVSNALHTEYTNPEASDSVNVTVGMPGAPLYRVNAGGPLIADAPMDWGADTNGNPSPYVTLGTCGQCNKTFGSGSYGGANATGAPNNVFGKERWDHPDAPEMIWEFPVDAAGDYELRLYFIEAFATAAGTRIFDVRVEGITALENYDIFVAAGGKNIPVEESIIASVTDGSLTIEFVHNVENPKVNGLEVLPLSNAPTNTPPAIDPVADQTMVEGETLTVTTVVTDADGDALTVDVSSTPDAAAFTSSSVTDSGGSYGIQLTFTPQAGDAGSYAFTLTADDGTEMTSELFTLNVTGAANTAPTIDPIGDQAATEGDTIGVAVSASDPDVGDTLTLSLAITDTATDTAVDPARYTFTDGGDGTANLSWTTQTGDAAGYTATVTASDGTASTTESFAIAIAEPAANQPPVVTNPGDQTGNEGDLVSLPVQATAPEAGQTLTYSATNLPPSLTINAQSGVISGTLDVGVDGADGVFQEENGIVVIEAESGDYPANWAEETTFSGFTGDGYLRYDGSDHFGTPGFDAIAYQVAITNPGTYQFQWRNTFGFGSSPTDHNDSWLKIEADSFYGQKGGSTVCPKGYDPAENDCTGAAPAGAGSSGWFKIYRSGGNQGQWTWSTNTSDNDPHAIFARFDSPGVYTILVSGRSKHHTIDRLVLSKSDYSGNPQSTSLAESTQSSSGTPGAADNSPYTVTVTATDDGTPSESTAVDFLWTVNAAGTGGTPSAEITVNGGSDNLFASTFSNGSFVINNTGDVDIVGVEFDLTSAFMRDVVFDPVGTAGDSGAKCFEPNSGASTVGLIAPADPCVTPFSKPHNGIDNDEGYDILGAEFNDFNSGEKFTFSVDMDPTSIKGDQSTGDAGSVSGLEIIGTKVTVNFANGESIVTSLWSDGSNAGAKATAALSSFVPETPDIAVNGIGNPPAFVNETNQTVTIDGPIGATVQLFRADARLYIDEGGSGYDVDAFEANEVLAKQIYNATIDQGGSVEIPVALTQTASPNAGPAAGINHLIAVIVAPNGQTSLPSNVIVLDYDPANPNQALVIAPETLAFALDEGGTGSDSFTVSKNVGNQSEGVADLAVVYDAASGSVDWLTVPPTTTLETAQPLLVDAAGLAPGTYEATVTASGISDYASDVLTVSLTVNGVVSEATLNGSVLLQGRPAAPAAAWSVDLVVALYQPGTDTLVESLTPTTDQSGSFSLTGLTPGTYDVAVKQAHALQVVEAVTLAVGGNAVDFGTLLEGDANNDNVIELLDFSILANTFGKSAGETNYDERADFNQDDAVDLNDFSLLAANFGAQGQEPGGVSAAENMPAVEPATVASDVTLRVQPSVERLAVGEEISVTLLVEAGEQTVDAAGAVLRFDPALLEVVAVDASAALDTVLLSEQAVGQLRHEAGKLGEPFPNGAVELATVRLRAVGAGEASLRFAAGSSVYRAGQLVLGSTADGSVTIADPNTDPNTEPDTEPSAEEEQEEVQMNFRLFLPITQN